jgi:hypothetical protein
MTANEENTFNLNDLWVSAAIAQETSVFDDEDEEEGSDGENVIEATPASSAAGTPRPTGTPGSQGRSSARKNRLASEGGNTLHRTMYGRRVSTGRRFSSSSGALPAIFGHTGLAAAPAVAAAYENESPGTQTTDPFFPPPPERRPLGGLSAIAERGASTINVGEASPLLSPNAQAAEKPVSAWKALPMGIIVQVSLT